MKKILIVEDDPITAKVYSTRLESAGYLVEVADSGRKGLAELDHFKPDGLLIDFMMPGMNGLDLVRAIRARPDYKTTPIMIFSNAVVPDVIKEAKEAGVTSVFDKSNLNPTQLIHAFQKADLCPSAPVPLTTS